MGQESRIQWTHHTFNPWRGCTHVSPGCEHCYAEALSKRNPAQLGTWGAGGTRVIAAESYWRQPERWNRAAEAAGERHRVFCASLADVFEDRDELDIPRRRLFALIVATPHLDWLILTKRPRFAQMLLTSENFRGAVDDQFVRRHAQPGEVAPRRFAFPLPNVWLGTTVEDQRRADERIPILIDTPAAVRFLSCEPLLGPVDLDSSAIAWWARFHDEGKHHTPSDAGPIDWIIVGGESGAQARPMDLAWARSLVEQGRSAGVPVFVKQLGRLPVTGDHGPLIASESGRHLDSYTRLPLIDHLKGGDPDEWPADLRVREFPTLEMVA